jgi:ppGpp synthetase/RelA/SpoT-type nucleotidyltranferase
MNVLYIALKRYSKVLDPKIPVVQRLKRMTSIQRKLLLLKNKNLKLSEIQDIGGCRAILQDVKSVYSFADRLKNSQMKHKLEYENDYIADPKLKSGYRGLHLIYSYFSDKSKNYNGHRIEIQLRTPLQHAWATAVETVDTFTNQFLKSNQGDKNWRRFFKLMATVIAIRENTKPASDTPVDNQKIRNALIQCSEQIKIIRSINQSGRILPEVMAQDKESHYFLVILDSQQRTTRVRGFKKKDSKLAAQEYLKVERDNANNPHIDAVLVSTDTIEMLQSTYINYFLDMRTFAEIVEGILK